VLSIEDSSNDKQTENGQMSRSGPHSFGGKHWKEQLLTNWMSSLFVVLFGLT
jgi:hypothetical protein